MSEKGFAAVGNKCLIYRGQHGGIWLAEKVDILGRTIHRKMSTKTRTATVTSLEAGQGRETGGADKPKPTKRRRTEPEIVEQLSALAKSMD